MSSHCSHDGRLSTTPAIASMRTGARRSGPVSAAETTMAVAPSAGTSQSYRQIGDEIIRAARSRHGAAHRPGVAGGPWWGA
jgi:hypothetical protein